MDEQRKLEIAGRLRQLWEESDETYLSIAEAIDVRERTVASWLSPTNPEPISYKSAKKYAELFDISIDWLWRGEDGIRVPADFMERLERLELEVALLRGASSEAEELEQELEDFARRSESSGRRTAKPPRASRKK